MWVSITVPTGNYTLSSPFMLVDKRKPQAWKGKKHFPMKQSDRVAEMSLNYDSWTLQSSAFSHSALFPED